MLLNDTHKLELLEIVENNSADIASLLDYLENNLDILPTDLEGEDQETLKFFIIKSFNNEISNFQSEKKLESVNELLEELEEGWDACFNENVEYRMYKLTINGQTYYEELDFSGGEEEMNCDSNYDKISSEYLAEPKPIKELPEIRFNLAEILTLGQKLLWNN
ncbi:hypothetical protein [Rickettsia endosymbiont of Nabis limbatus]|uniref:hypothetical protein n=2 Tax=unclassified Rickettsia TaxID=114295 RepID=UPI003AF36E81